MGAAVSSWRALIWIALLAVGGCSQAFSERPTLAERTQSLDDLLKLPPPRARLDTAVFRFLDQTGQHKPNDTFAEYSFAVTQGGTNLLIKALHDAGSGSWFRVVERSNIGDLLQERQIVRANRIQYAGPKGAVRPLGPLLNAGTIFEGGIVGYDSNIVTGGAGANYLGIGASVQYRKDTVTVALRTVSTLTGEVLTAVEVSKTIFSTLLDASIFKFVDFNKLLQAEVGFSTNEPVTICVTQAIELAVYATIMEGTLKGYWGFADQATQARLTEDYLKTRGGVLPYMPRTTAPAPISTVRATPPTVPAPATPSRHQATTSNVPMPAATSKPATTPKPPVPTPNAPATTSKPPAPAANVPATTAKPPAPVLKPPATPSSAPATTSKPPPITSSVPATIAEVPVATSKLVATNAEVPATPPRPVATTSDAPATPSRLSATASNAPVTSLKLPTAPPSSGPVRSLKLPPMPSKSD
ncbi:MAG: Curli production assembly/transport component CsgG [Enhydrobacter sp.]|jgi:curli production assembly/transport component CsgG|nr:MAG: Curli production assembly/transport component CsgG [Enhydrobacter sp.]